MTTPVLILAGQRWLGQILGAEPGRSRPATSVELSSFGPARHDHQPHRVAVWVAVHRGSSPFSRVRASALPCGANVHEPLMNWASAPAALSSSSPFPRFSSSTCEVFIPASMRNRGGLTSGSPSLGGGE